MCGIGGYAVQGATPTEFENFAKFIRLFTYIDMVRGDDSTGIFSYSRKTDQFGILKEALPAWQFLDKHREYLVNKFPEELNNIVMVHNRAATIGDITRHTAHPHMVGDTVVCHNGTVHGIADKLKGDIQTDSQYLTKLIDEEGLAGLGVLGHKQCYALSIWNRNDPTKVQLITNGDRPLVIYKLVFGKGILWSSEKVLFEFANRALNKSVEVVEVKDHHVYEFDTETGELDIHDFTKDLKPKIIPYSQISKQSSCAYNRYDERMAWEYDEYDSEAFDEDTTPTMTECTVLPIAPFKELDYGCTTHTPIVFSLACKNGTTMYEGPVHYPNKLSKEGAVVRLSALWYKNFIDPLTNKGKQKLFLGFTTNVNRLIGLPTADTHIPLVVMEGSIHLMKGLLADQITPRALRKYLRKYRETMKNYGTFGKKPKEEVPAILMDKEVEDAEDTISDMYKVEGPYNTKITITEWDRLEKANCGCAACGHPISNPSDCVWLDAMMFHKGECADFYLRDIMEA